MYISLSNIEVLDILQQEYIYFNFKIISFIENSTLSLVELLNNRDLYNKIASSLMPVLIENEQVLFPDLSTIYAQDEYFKYLNIVLDNYNHIMSSNNSFTLGSLEIGILPDEIVVNGDSPIENRTNLVYNLIAIKILLDYKRKQNEFRN